MVYNKTIKKIMLYSSSYHIVIKYVSNSLTKARSHDVYSLSLMFHVRSFYYNCYAAWKIICNVGACYDTGIIIRTWWRHPVSINSASDEVV